MSQLKDTPSGAHDGEKLAHPADANSAHEPLPAGRHRRKQLILLGGVLAVVVAGAWLGYPLVTRALTTVSTDDAYVNGHVTFVAPRVGGEVVDVRVDDTNRVKKGDLLVRLDPEPYRVQVQLKQAAVDVAKADLVAATAQVRAAEAQARSLRWKLETAIQQVDNQVALLRARTAALRADVASLSRARADFARAEKSAASGATSQEELDQRRQATTVAEAQVRQALEEVNQVRVGLGVPPSPVAWNQLEGWKDDGPWNDLTRVPANLSQTYSGVRQALAELVQAAAQFIPGLDLPLSESTPAEVLKQFRDRDVRGDIDQVLRDAIPKAPAVLQANAKLAQTQQDLAQAELNLRYTDVYAEIDGVVARRSVNPGNYVQPGQQLMAVRSLDVWVDCNFKETQLADLRIGQRVDLAVDMYPGRVFRGRVTGFTPGTGSTLSLLPAQNATGNFVKVVQRLPVRVDLTEPPPPDTPLFPGLSVIPTVYYKEPATGPTAGEFLQRPVIGPPPGTPPPAPSGGPTPDPKQITPMPRAKGPTR